ncbi:hypothetical protein [Aquihabitans sp. McL0605]|uniref:hypothetical protein n=1 Tax=Aquihabitans sp. McL0605 TaxID=3415671 RepID=UPI003CEF6AB7
MTVAVTVAAEVVAEVTLGRHRHPCVSTGLESRPVGGPVAAVAALDTGRLRDAAPAVVPDDAAWPARSADRAAAERWGERHRGVLTVERLAVADAADHVLATAAIECAGRALVPDGARRLDILLPASGPLAPALRAAGWMAGSTADGTVLSLPLRYPWRLVTDPLPVPGRVIARLPARTRRTVRRLAGADWRAAPELARTAIAEGREAVRHASTPGRARQEPVPGAPAGTTPFAVTRYRTLQRAFALVPPPLWATRFVDIGAGDGRVLEAAERAGAAAVLGRELDAGLASRAEARLGRAGAVEVGDALDAPLPLDTGVLFLNNPFGVASVERLAGLTAAALAARPRPLLVIYINPPTVVPFTDAGLALVHCAPTHSVLATVGRPPQGPNGRPLS